MRQKYNINKLLHSATTYQSYLNELNISEEEDETLKECRKLVRATLREGFAKLRELASSGHQESNDYVAQLKPKFWTQGSYVYKTLNKPAHTPPQQIDLDDGVYFPMDVVEGQPKAAKKIIFKLVDDMLLELAKVKGWRFDNRKNTCARLIVDENIHIDIPIYAIPKERYKVLAEAKAFNNRQFSDDMYSRQEVRLDPNEVYLALRDEEHWKQSDPMKLQDWFKNESSVHTRLRRVCRYLKAWRDFTWEDGGPSSITLMVAAAETFDRNLNDNGKEFSSDCDALLAVVRSLPIQFSGQISNPVEDGEIIFPRHQKAEEVQEIQTNISELKDQVEIALCRAHNKHDAVNTLVSTFGDRFPARPDSIDIVSVTALVRSSKAISQERPDPPESMRSA